ncbi:hypothetical protein FB567DRAFT_545507 [Paraphoma chrysanthemicola]|uniref:Uncharacterized protein n=1 Tax=Paraphoma chrysanthemicola TaxID=798071 RepID=A0A8K0W3C8_9PLEO|nr:hypothetical protein FB567DRAFT_545507 [Paraphoma chrysanthemicola]
MATGIVLKSALFFMLLFTLREDGGLNPILMLAAVLIGAVQARFEVSIVRSVVTEPAAPAHESTEIVGPMITIPHYPLAHCAFAMAPQARITELSSYYNNTSNTNNTDNNPIGMTQPDIPGISPILPHVNTIDHDAALRTRLMPDRRRAFLGTEYRTNSSFQRQTTAQLAKLWTRADAHGRLRLKAQRPRIPPVLQRGKVVPPRVPRPVKKRCVVPSRMPQEMNAPIAASTPEKEEQYMGVEPSNSFNDTLSDIDEVYLFRALESNSDERTAVGMQSYDSPHHADDLDIGYISTMQENNSYEEAAVGLQSTGPLRHVGASEEIGPSSLPPLVGNFAGNGFVGGDYNGMEGLYSQDLPSQPMPETWPSFFSNFLHIDMLQEYRNDSPLENLS